MMRICPKCGAYYADGSSGFCRADGMPLVNVDPNSASWNEGARVIQENENSLRKQKRGLKWRRVLISTMMIATIAVCATALQRWIYVEKVSPPPSPTPTPTPSPTPRPSPSPSPSPSPRPSPKPCTKADQERESNAISAKYLGVWQQAIEKELSLLVGAQAAALGQRVKPRLVAPPAIPFSPECTGADVTVTFDWDAGVKLNGPSPPKVRTFRCEKHRDAWLCQPRR